MSDKIDIVLDSLDRLHDKLDRIDDRTRSLEESRAHHKGAVTVIGLIMTAISAAISFIVSHWPKP